MKNVTINLQSELSENELNNLLQKMLWDSEFSYEFENANWKIK